MTPDWLKYEQLVLRLLQTTGHRCEHNVHVRGVRAKRQIDILVHVPAPGRDQLWVVECKHRQRSVTKADLMNLRSLVEDVGASHGYLVSESAAQRGAREYAERTNLTVGSAADLAIELRREQLRTTSSTAGDLELTLTAVEEDFGNWDSEAVVSIASTTGEKIGDRLVELVVERQSGPEWVWVVTPELHPALRTQETKLNVSLPWDPIKWLDLPMDIRCRIAGESVTGQYRVTVRSTSGPMSLVVQVSLFK